MRNKKYNIEFHNEEGATDFISPAPPPPPAPPCSLRAKALAEAVLLLAKTSKKLDKAKRAWPDTGHDYSPYYKVETDAFHTAVNALEKVVFGES